MIRLALLAPELLDFIGRLRASRQQNIPAMDDVLFHIADYVANEARENTEKVRLNLAGNYTHAGSALRATIHTGNSMPPTVYYGGGEPHAGGHEFGATYYRQFPVYDEEGYILGEVINRDDHDSSEIFPPEILDAFVRRIFPV